MCYILKIRNAPATVLICVVCLPVVYPLDKIKKWRRGVWNLTVFRGLARYFANFCRPSCLSETGKTAGPTWAPEMQGGGGEVLLFS